MFEVRKGSQQSRICGSRRAGLPRKAKYRHSSVGKIPALATLLMLLVSVGDAYAQNKTRSEFRFVNIVDNTRTFTSFATFPAINNHGAVAFEAIGPGSDDGVYRWHDGVLTPIAKSSRGGLNSFGNDPAINAKGVVAFDADVEGGHAIFTGNGVSTKEIVNSADQGLIGRFLGAPSINNAGTVAFFGSRNGFGSQVIFTGDGGPLTTVLDTLNSNFTGFENVAINASDELVFVGDRIDGSEGLFVIGSHDRLVNIIDTNNSDLSGFGDPVINRSGTVADDVFRNDGNIEILSGDQHRVIPRNDILGELFTRFEHPSINDYDTVAFFAVKIDGSSGVFIEDTGGASPIPVIQTGDILFGSTVVEVDLGRFALNNHFELVFQYTLQDGRSGVAIASLRRDERQHQQEDDDE